MAGSKNLKLDTILDAPLLMEKVMILIKFNKRWTIKIKQTYEIFLWRIFGTQISSNLFYRIPPRNTIAPDSIA